MSFSPERLINRLETIARPLTDRFAEITKDSIRSLTLLFSGVIALGSTYTAIKLLSEGQKVGGCWVATLASITFALAACAILDKNTSNQP